MNSESARPSAGGIDEHLYVKRQRIYPREVHGLFAWLRTAAVLVLLGAFYGAPWIRWDARQAILFDLPERKFHLFALTIWPQDFIYLAALLIIAALTLFFFTSLAGRLWCGYACPQTVWTEAFMWVERRIEGNRNRQMKLDQMSWNAHKFGVKSFKHVVWLLFSLWTGLTFVGFFTPILELAPKLVRFNAGPWETFWVFFYGFATYGNAGWMREQVCIYMCPYARFQSAMFDRNTLVISYDKTRGEPRGARSRNANLSIESLGDCVDCTLCVQACPTGIDIRDGLQYQCIGCAACIDACDGVMQKMGYPAGLVRYTTENGLMGKKTRVSRPRIIIYASLLSLFSSAVVWGIATRDPVSLDVIRDRNTLYRQTREGLIENVYTLKIINKGGGHSQFSVSMSGLDGANVLSEDRDIAVTAGEVRNVVVRVRIDPVHLKHRSSEVTFIVESHDRRLKASEPARFLGPATK
ncbi:MAG: cytochrome c oxidase accessory protein CcoG [Proteobacteria bacterium]|nr:cytochrome c oxidase accessory protein CcoG [Pseudomonadota bacterium]MBT5817453.1 cytochrome c oxidase accessory protein CcoG [Pseudomonadota bacterium]